MFSLDIIDHDELNSIRRHDMKYVLLKMHSGNIIACLLALLAAIIAGQAWITKGPQKQRCVAFVRHTRIPDIPDEDIREMIAMASKTMRMPIAGDRQNTHATMADTSKGVPASRLPAGSRLAGCNTTPPPTAVLQDFEGNSIYAGVVKLYGYNSTSGDFFHWCSGWLIAPDLVTTAAHCIYNSTTGTWTVRGSVFLLALLRLNGNPLSATGCTSAACQDIYGTGGYVDTEYEYSWVSGQRVYTDFLNTVPYNAFSGTDIGVLRLSQPFVQPYTYGWGDVAQEHGTRRWTGYPAEIQPGYLMTQDETDSDVSLGGTANSILIENTGLEGGASGSPLFRNTKSTVIVGMASATSDSRGTCPSYFTRLLGIYSLDGLVEDEGYQVLVLWNTHYVRYGPLAPLPEGCPSRCRIVRIIPPTSKPCQSDDPPLGCSKADAEENNDRCRKERLRCRR